MTRPAISFPTDFDHSRSLFRAAAGRLGWTSLAQPVPGTGPGGEALTIDVAISPAGDADRVLLVSSGLHGVEGPFGTAVQLATMAAWADGAGPPPGVRCVILHALNPYGYAWGRRVDANNVDPNRNFLPPGEAYQGSPDGYQQFDSLLNPKTAPNRWDLFPLKAWVARCRYGLPALKQALVGGQCDYPHGLFFGGHGPSTTYLALRERLGDWVGPAASVIHLDYHSGLGRWGTYKLLLDSPVTAETQDRMDRWFGPGTYEEDNPNGVGYVPRGSFGPWCAAQGLAPDYLYMVAEFGTYGHVPMLTALRAENQAHHWGRPGSKASERVRARLREVFCPASPDWRARVVPVGVDLIRRAAAGLQELVRSGSPR